MEPAQNSRFDRRHLHFVVTEIAGEEHALQLWIAWLKQHLLGIHVVKEERVGTVVLRKRLRIIDIAFGVPPPATGLHRGQVAGQFLYHQMRPFLFIRGRVRIGVRGGQDQNGVLLLDVAQAGPEL